jgi:hypothetical protein
MTWSTISLAPSYFTGGKNFIVQMTVDEISRVGSWAYTKTLKMLARDKHSSLIKPFVGYNEKNILQRHT